MQIGERVGLRRKIGVKRIKLGGDWGLINLRHRDCIKIRTKIGQTRLKRRKIDCGCPLACEACAQFILCCLNSRETRSNIIGGLRAWQKTGRNEAKPCSKATP